MHSDCACSVDDANDRFWPIADMRRALSFKAMKARATLIALIAVTVCAWTSIAPRMRFARELAETLTPKAALAG